MAERRPEHVQPPQHPEVEPSEPVRRLAAVFEAALLVENGFPERAEEPLRRLHLDNEEWRTRIWPHKYERLMNYARALLNADGSDFDFIEVSPGKKPGETKLFWKGETKNGITFYKTVTPECKAHIERYKRAGATFADVWFPPNLVWSGRQKHYVTARHLITVDVPIEHAKEAYRLAARRVGRRIEEFAPRANKDVQDAQEAFVAQRAEDRKNLDERFERQRAEDEENARRAAIEKADREHAWELEIRTKFAEKVERDGWIVEIAEPLYSLRVTVPPSQTEIDRAIAHIRANPRFKMMSKARQDQEIDKSLGDARNPLTFKITHRPLRSSTRPWYVDESRGGSVTLDDADPVALCERYAKERQTFDEENA